MKAIVVIAANSLRSLIRQRENIFFVFLLPLLLIVVLGATVSSARPEVRVVVGDERSAAAQRLVERLQDEDDLMVTVDDDLDDAVALVQREDVNAVVIIADDYGQVLDGGGRADIEYLALPDSTGFEIQGIVQAVVAAESSEVRVARAAELLAGEPGVEAAFTAQPVAVDTIDGRGDPFQADDLFGYVAAQELVLFLFTMSMAASAALILARRLGVTRRMLVTAATPTQIVFGHLLGRYLISLVQAGFILGATALLFDLDWGSWPATLTIVALFSLVAAAVAVVLGSVAANENQSVAIGISLGLALAAFGGCMVPLEIFPPTLRTAAHVTPHAWAVDAFAEVLQRGGGIAAIGTELAVLAGYSAVLLAAAAFALRRAIVT